MSPRIGFCLAAVVLGPLLWAREASTDGGNRDNPILPSFQSKREDGVKTGELKCAAAVAFAKNVLNAIDIIQEDYVHEINQEWMINWAVRELYRHIGERVPRKIEARLRNVRALRREQRLELLIDARLAIGAREDLDNLKDLTITLNRMLRRLDPYTTYTDPDNVPQLMCGRIEFTGIGVRLEKDPASGQVRVVSPIKGGPAYKAKVIAGDLITTITRAMDRIGKPLSPPEVVPTRGLSIEKANRLLLGVAGTKVTLTIQREGEKKPIEVEVPRGRFELESVLGAAQGKRRL